MKKILIVKLSSIGDVIHTLPTVPALRKKFPNAEISWLVGETAEGIITNNPDLDQVIVFPRNKLAEEFKANKWQGLKEMGNFIKELRSTDFDLAFDLQGLFKSGILTYLSGADIKIGYSDAREGSSIFYNRKITPPSTEIPVVDKYLKLVETVGAKTEEVEFKIKISQQDKDKVEQLLASLGLDVDQFKVVINPFTSWSSKNWLSNRYAKLADRIITELDSEVIFTGGPNDSEQVDQILDQMEEQAYNLAGKTNLKQLSELYKRADLFIGGDTGPLHLAVAVNTRVIAIMGPTTPARNGPYGNQHTVLQANIECKNCWNRVCPRENHLCMERISVEKVLETIENGKLRMEN